MRIPAAVLLSVLSAGAGELTLETRSFVIERGFTATVLPPAPLVLKPDADNWASFEIRSILPHGSRVNAGDVLVEFETRDIDRKLEDTRRSIESAGLNLAQAESDLQALKETFEIKLDAAKRASRNAADDLAFFNTTGRKAQEDRATQALKRSREVLSNEREELRQLEKMYKADDLTEETEEIILVRQRDAVSAAETATRLAEIDHKRIMDTTLPRQAEDFSAAASTTSLALRKAEGDLTRQIRLKENDILAFRTALDRQKDDLDKLAAARKYADPFKAPVAGWFYHGAIEDGRWTTGEAVKALVPRSSVPARKPFATFIPAASDPILVAFTDEASARTLAKDAAALVILTGREELALTATVSKIAEAPGTDGRYRVDFTPAWPKGAASVPGATATLRVIVYENPAALTVPAAALKPSKDGWAVPVKLADGKSSLRTVQRGRVSGDQVEILSGLEAGQVIITP